MANSLAAITTEFATELPHVIAFRAHKCQMSV